MHTGLDDNAIITNVLAGNHAAFAGLVERYQDFVFTLAFRLVKNREDAEEIAQDAFVKAYRYLANFRGDSKFSTWLYTIVNNTGISFLRKKKIPVESLDQEHVFEKVATQQADPDNRIDQQARVKILNDAMRYLSADDARVLTLFYQAEQSLEETAQVLGIEVNAVKVRLHRARGRLREKMEQHFPTAFTSF